ncbi:thiamine pyrophosphate-binding protein [Corynebacterium falsenii]
MTHVEHKNVEHKNVEHKNVAHFIARQLLAEQATVFGVVGNGNIHIVSDFHRAGGRYISTRHEAGAVAAADAFYRATGTIAVATSTYGPGFSNALTPLSEAHAARIPLVYITADAPAAGLRPIDIDQRAIAAAMGLQSVVVTEEHCADVQQAADLVAEAFNTARRTSLPVVVFVPFDLVVREGDLADPGTVGAGQPTDREAREDPESVAVAGRAEMRRTQWAVVNAPDTEAAGNQNTVRTIVDNTDEFIQSLADELRAAHRPLIVVGRGAVESGVCSQIDELAAALGALTCTTVMARSSVDPHWNLGVAGGFAHRGRLETFRSADLVLVLGASLNKLQTRAGTLFGDGARVVRIDSNPLHRPFVTVDSDLRAPLEQAIPHLLAAVADGATDVPAGTWRDQLGALPPEETEELDPGCFNEVASDGKLDPRFVLRRLNALLPPRRSVVTDGGHFLGWVPKYVDAPDPYSTVLVGTAVMTIGLGLSSGVGVAAARPESFTALISGDGGTLMGLADAQPFLAEVGNSAGGGALIVLNDAAYGAEVHQYARKGLELDPMEVPDVSFAAAGAPFGVEGITITSPEELADGGALATFLEQHRGEAVIVDVKISREPIADFLRE